MSSETTQPWVRYLTTGATGGLFSGLILGRSQHEAQGVSLGAIIVTAAAALVHHRNGYVDSRAAMLIAPAAIVFWFAGGLLVNRLPPRHCSTFARSSS